jgi:Predicted nucleic-acid-binding protein containing a Zn-ribbon
MEYKLIFKDYSDSLKKKGKLLGLKCRKCGAITCPPKMTCQECASTDLDVIELSGNGEIATFTVVNVGPEGREAEAPYIIVLVKLDEGPWIMGNFADMDPGKITMGLIGKRVKLGTKVFPGDKYSAGDGARPLFSFA